MRRYLILPIISLSLALPLCGQNAIVWDFATRDGGKTATTASLTAEFEEALLQNSTYTVLERRSLDRLRAVIANEKALQDVGAISDAGKAELTKLGVAVVLFGEMFDDVDSGDVSITVTIQDFSGRKLLIKSTLMRRGLLHDATSRRESLTALVNNISSETATAPQSRGGRISSDGLPQAVETTEVAPATCSGAPTAKTIGVRFVTAYSAELLGSSSSDATRTWFDFDQSEALTFSVQDLRESGVVGHLKPHTTYFYRFVAQNDCGTTRGGILKFETRPAR